MPDPGGRGAAAAAFGLTLAGLAVLYSGLSRASPVTASPVTWTFTEEEIARASDGRIVVAAGAVVLAGAAALVAAGGRRRRAVLVGLPGAVCLGLAVAFPPPGGAWAWIAFLPLAPIAVIAALPLRRS